VNFHWAFYCCLGGSIGPVAPKRIRQRLGAGVRSLGNKIVGQTHIKKPTSTQATAPEKSTPVEQDNNKTPNENSQNEPSSEQDNNETPDQQQEDNTVTEQTETEQFVSLLSCVTGVLSLGVFVCSVTALSSCC
jgi:cobalamin biosynthesis protein CobT